MHLALHALYQPRDEAAIVCNCIHDITARFFLCFSMINLIHDLHCVHTYCYSMEHTQIQFIYMYN